ncbi:MAG: hypothetical protein LBK66_08790 [Spirochaetaceae bacterium]|nr:hypothetical protein [Spirochaetaceae bacterium]
MTMQIIIVEAKPLTAAIDVSASPPPTAQTSLRWRQAASAERMRNLLVGWRARMLIALALPTARSKCCFRYANAERMRTRWRVC